MSNTNHFPDDIFKPIRTFFQTSSAGGIVLVIAALVAIIIANSPLYPYYDYILHSIKFKIGFASITENGFDFEVKKSILHWINDGFMAIFFFLVGLEIKREVVTGELSTRARALLPAIAAIGGMIVPAAIYLSLIHISEPTRPERISYAVFCLKKKKS